MKLFHRFLVSIVLDKISLSTDFHSFVCKIFCTVVLRWPFFFFSSWIFYSLPWILLWAYFSFLVIWDIVSILCFFNSGKFPANISLTISSLFYSSGIFMRWMWVTQFVLYSQKFSDHLKNLIVSLILLVSSLLFLL